MTFFKNSKILTSALLIIACFLLFLSWQTIVTWVSPTSASKQKITLAVTQYPGSGLIYLALEKGYFAQEGLNINLQSYTSGRDALAATQDGHANLGTVADMPVVYARMKKQKISVVATIFTARQSYGVIARRDRGIHRFGDLRDKRVGLTFRTDGHYVFSTMLARHLISLDQVELEDLQPEQMMDALLSGKVDAVSTWEPWLKDFSHALDKNGIEFRALGDLTLNYNLAGQSDWISSHQNDVQGLLKALLKAKKFVEENPQDAYTLIAKLMNIKRSVFDTVGPTYQYVVQLDQNLLTLMRDEARWAIENKFTDQNDVPNFLNAIDTRALTAVQPSVVNLK